jgi:hypothetical protein
LGLLLGLRLGQKLGLLLGLKLGQRLGLLLGLKLGQRLGLLMGLKLGQRLGPLLGLRLGQRLGRWCEGGVGVGWGGVGGEETRSSAHQLTTREVKTSLDGTAVLRAGRQWVPMSIRLGCRLALHWQVHCIASPYVSLTTPQVPAEHHKRSHLHQRGKGQQRQHD